MEEWKDEMQVFDDTIAELEQQLEQAHIPVHISTMQYGKYTDEVRQNEAAESLPSVSLCYNKRSWKDG